MTLLKLSGLIRLPERLSGYQDISERNSSYTDKTDFCRAGFSILSTSTASGTTSRISNPTKYKMSTKNEDLQHFVSCEGSTYCMEGLSTVGQVGFDILQTNVATIK